MGVDFGGSFIDKGKMENWYVIHVEEMDIR
jgi:hypothetical protein